MPKFLLESPQTITFRTVPQISPLLQGLKELNYAKYLGQNIVTQSRLTLWDSMDCTLPSFSVYGDIPGRTLEWVFMLSSRGPSQPRDLTQVSLIAGKLFTI